jgi:hypothetical protein
MEPLAFQMLDLYIGLLGVVVVSVVVQKIWTMYIFKQFGSQKIQTTEASLKANPTRKYTPNTSHRPSEYKRTKEERSWR